MISSAFRMACAASGLTCTPSGLRKTWLIGEFCLGICDSTSTVLPLMDATRVTSRWDACVVDVYCLSQVGCVGLEATQQRAQTGSAADRDDARPAAAQPECVDHLDHAARVRPGEKWAEDGLRELQVTDHEQPDAEDAEHDRTRPVGQELQRDPVEALRQVGCLVDLLEGVRNAEHEDQLGHHEQEEPAFDLQPGREPAKPTRGW